MADFFSVSEKERKKSMNNNDNDSEIDKKKKKDVIRLGDGGGGGGGKTVCLFGRECKEAHIQRKQGSFRYDYNDGWMKIKREES